MNKKKIEVNTPPEGYKKSLKSRIIVAIVLALVLVPAIIAGGWYYFFAIMGFVLIAIAEVIRAPRKKYNWTVYVITYSFILSFVYWMFFKQNMVRYVDNPVDFEFSLENYYQKFEISIIGIASSLLAYSAEGIFDKNFDFGDVAYFFFMSMLVGVGFQAIYFLRYFPFSLAFDNTYASVMWHGAGWGYEALQRPGFHYVGSCELLVFVALSPIVNDIAAYFGGIYFGKHKLNERVSPKKTWEGFFFGWAAGFAVPFIFAMVLAAAGVPVLPFLTLDKWYWIFGICLIGPIISDLGDLTFSLIKRYYNIKDYGNILRGHGGILDRVDSIAFACIGITMLIIFIANSWNILV